MKKELVKEGNAANYKSRLTSPWGGSVARRQRLCAEATAATSKLKKSQLCQTLPPVCARSMDSCRRRQRFLCRDTNFWYCLCEVAVTDTTNHRHAYTWSWKQTGSLIIQPACRQVMMEQVQDSSYFTQMTWKVVKLRTSNLFCWRTWRLCGFDLWGWHDRLHVTGVCNIEAEDKVWITAAL